MWICIWSTLITAFLCEGTKNTYKCAKEKNYVILIGRQYNSPQKGDLSSGDLPDNWHSPQSLEKSAFCILNELLLQCYVNKTQMYPDTYWA